MYVGDTIQVYVYVLRSLKTGCHYVGISKYKTKRLHQHNTGQNRSTKGKGPWVEILKESYLNYNEALEREKYLKSGKGREWLKGLLA
ncbi:MAG: GIY-YIG nuclease family protein [Kiritimatiellae bacterium]|nr:GIY-YIG nuclease family protein [Kiritimatiellia bacterium]MDD5520902.1 GIY-YIG nuclease family protein [Kiritimatiellia bacterium]